MLLHFLWCWCLLQESRWSVAGRSCHGVKKNTSGRTMDASNHQLLVCWQTLQHIITSSRPPKIVNYKFSTKFRCCLFITSSSPYVPHPWAPEHPWVSTSLCPTSPSPMSQCPRVPRPCVPESSSPQVLASQVPRPHPTFSHSQLELTYLYACWITHMKCC